MVANEHNDALVNEVLQGIGSFSDTIKPANCKPNLNSLEKKGLNWLVGKIKANILCICKADKGGALIVLEGNLIRNMIESKV